MTLGHDHNLTEAARRAVDAHESAIMEMEGRRCADFVDHYLQDLGVEIARLTQYVENSELYCVASEPQPTPPPGAAS